MVKWIALGPRESSIKILKTIWKDEFSSHTHTTVIASTPVTSHLARGLLCFPASVISFTKQAPFIWRAKDPPPILIDLYPPKGYKLRKHLKS